MCLEGFNGSYKLPYILKVPCRRTGEAKGSQEKSADKTEETETTGYSLGHLCGASCVFDVICAKCESCLDLCAISIRSFRTGPRACRDGG